MLGLPRIERGDEGARHFAARQPVEARIALGRGFGFLLRRQNKIARRLQHQKCRGEGPGGAKCGGAERKRLKQFGEARVFGLGRRLLGQKLLPGRQRPAAQTQGEDAQSRRNLNPSRVDRPALGRGSRGRETPENQRGGKTGGRRHEVRRERASPARKRAAEAHQSPEQQCDDKVRRHAETPRLNRRLNAH